MADDRHTRGPWGVVAAVGDQSVEAADGSHVALVFDWSEEDPLATSLEAEANARLIAAAPELLEWLRSAMHALRSYQYGNSSTDLAAAVADGCETAIREATGQ